MQFNVNNSISNTYNRNRQIDSMKGVSISLVVLGHALIVCQPEYNYNILFRIISSFNMTLFMFLGGYTAYHYSLKKQSFSFLIKKFKNLVLPFLSWYFILSFAVKLSINNVNILTYTNSLIKDPGVGLWFLWVLFLNYFILFFLLKINVKKRMYAIIIAMLLIQMSPFSILGISYLKSYFPFFILGFLFCQYKNDIKKYINVNIVFVTCCIIFIFLIPFWNADIGPTFMPLLSNIPHVVALIIKKIYMYILPVSEIAITYFLTNKLHSNKKMLYFLGNNTLEIYVVHWHLCFLGIINFGYLLTTNNIINQLMPFIMTIILIAVSILISKIFKTIKILNLLFLGK